MKGGGGGSKNMLTVIWGGGHKAPCDPRSWSHARGACSPKNFEIFNPLNQFSCNMSSNLLNFILRLSVQTLMRDLHVQ